MDRMKLLEQTLEFSSVTDIISYCGNKRSELVGGIEENYIPKGVLSFGFMKETESSKGKNKS
jgi:hypothetical protein